MVARLLATLAACLLSSGSQAIPFEGQKSKEELDALAKIGSDLRDHKTAEVIGMKVVGGAVVCGYLKAKNGLGGYVGSMPFAVIVPPEPSLLSPFDDIRDSAALYGETEKLRQVIALMCDAKDR